MSSNEKSLVVAADGAANGDDGVGGGMGEGGGGGGAPKHGGREGSDSGVHGVEDKPCSWHALPKVQEFTADEVCVP